VPTIRQRRRPRTAFVLSGGGNLGAIQIGMLRALTEREIQPDVVIGCSVGAMNGAAYAANPTIAGVRRLDTMWRSITAPDLLPSTRIPNALLLVRKGESLYRNDGLRRTILSALDGRSEFDDLEVPFQCVATEVDGAAERWFTDGPLVDPILASAALPSVYPIVSIDGRRYLDGGVVNNVPVARAVELGAKRIYVLHVGLHGRPEAEVKRPIDAALIAYWIARNSRLARDLAQLPRSVEAIVLPPGDRPELRYDDFTQTADLIDQGYLGAAQYLDELAEAEASEPRLAERLRREMFRTAEWRHRRRPARDTDPDVVPEPEPTSDTSPEAEDADGAAPSDLPAQSGT
jgi:NTE family protein